MTDAFDFDGDEVELGGLFDPKVLARSTDPGTSKVSAARAESVQARHEQAILDALERIEKGTKDEIAEATGLDAVAVARRMRRLADAGRVVETTAIGLTPAGRPAIVWGRA